MKTKLNIIYPAFALFAFACFALLPTVHAVNPPPDGGYPGRNTAEGTKALLSLTTGLDNTAVGFQALSSNTSGNQNTAMGSSALQSTTGLGNSAFGWRSLKSNIAGHDNTAVGRLALANNDVSGLGQANFNAAIGSQALQSNTDGNSNDAVGFGALGGNTTGLQNNAMGFQAATNNQDGEANTAIGDSSLFSNVSGSFNTIVGWSAADSLEGNDNIYIGATAGHAVTSESGTIRIGDPAFVFACHIAGISGVPVTGDPVCVNGDLLGVCAGGSSPASMNELLKEHRFVQQLKVTTEKQAARINLQEGQIQTLTAALKQQAELESTVARQQKQIEALTAGLQKVSAQIELSKATPQMVQSSQ